jgi:hypothetical protein
MTIHGTTFHNFIQPFNALRLYISPNVLKTQLMLLSGIIMALETTVLKEVHLRFGPLEAKQRPLPIKPKFPATLAVSLISFSDVVSATCVFEARPL